MARLGRAATGHTRWRRPVHDGWRVRHQACGRLCL